MPNLYLRKGGKNYYSPLVDVSSTRASDLTVRHGGQTYAVAKIPGTQVGNLDLYDLGGNSWTVSGSPTITTTNAKFDKAVYFNGSAAIYLNNVVLGGADFTVDFWFYHNTSSGYPSIICWIAKMDSLNNSGTILLCDRSDDSNDKVALHVPNTSFLQQGGISMNTLHHVAYVYQHSASIGKIFVDGVLKKIYTSFSLSGYSCRVVLGAYATVSEYRAIGSVDEFRISNCARWTADFTPPTEPYALDDNTLVLWQTK